MEVNARIVSIFCLVLLPRVARAQWAMTPWPPNGGRFETPVQPNSQLQQQTTTPLTNQALAEQNANAKNAQTPNKQTPDVGSLLNSVMGAGGGGSPAGKGSGTTPQSRGSDDTPDSASGAGKLPKQVSLARCSSSQPDPTALTTALECAGKLSNATDNKLGLVDIRKKLMFIINRDTKETISCVRISTGSGGQGSSEGQSPRGLMLTAAHGGKGTKYASSREGEEDDAIGLTCTDSETCARTKNGVVIHPAHGGASSNASAGCFGVEDQYFTAVKRTLYGSDSAPKKNVIFSFDETNREKCSSSGGRPNQRPTSDTDAVS